MPLPDPNTAWPPPELTRTSALMVEADAWYSSDPAKLDHAYRLASQVAVRDRPAQYRGGIVGGVARMLWGRPHRGDGPDDRVHVPIAADLAQASADLLFAEPPTITADNGPANDRIQEYIADGLFSTLPAGFEVAAALGGTYLRATLDPVRPHAFSWVIDADRAIPEFRWGRLVAVTFWWRLTPVGQHPVLRHLERHELDQQGRGVVLHGLYQGDDSILGRLVPLTDHPSTEGLKVDADGALLGAEPTRGLLVSYAPNLTPQRILRDDPMGSQLGRSDFEPPVIRLMDRLDFVYTSWMRDIDLGRGRIIVPDYMLDDLGPGNGVSFDTDRAVYSPIGAAVDDGVGITIAQFQIRVAEHQQTTQQLVEDILRSAGYSSQTFGENEDGGSATATEVNARTSRSGMTRDRKIRHAQPAIAEHVTKLLALDGIAATVTVQFPDGTQDTPLALAQTAQALRTAQAASTQTLVAMVHPDWSDDQVKAEAGLISSETGASVEDPGTFGQGGNGLTDPSQSEGEPQ